MTIETDEPMEVIFISPSILKGEGCICLPSTSMGRRIGTEVDRDCPLHGAELRAHEAETGITYSKPVGKDRGPFGVTGDSDSIAAFVKDFKAKNPWWERNEPDPEIVARNGKEWLEAWRDAEPKEYASYVGELIAIRGIHGIVASGKDLAEVKDVLEGRDIRLFDVLITRVEPFALSPDLSPNQTYIAALEKTLRAYRMFSGMCVQCGDKHAYKGAVYCGAGCAARGEAHESLTFKDGQGKQHE